MTHSKKTFRNIRIKKISFFFLEFDVNNDFTNYVTTQDLSGTLSGFPVSPPPPLSRFIWINDGTIRYDMTLGEE